MASPSIQASQSLVSPSIQTSPSLINPSIQASQSMGSPSILASQSLVGPSIQNSQLLVSPSVHSQSTETSSSKERVQTFMSLIQSDSARHSNRSPSGSDSENLIFCPAGAEIGEIYTQKPKSRGNRTTYRHCSSEGNLQTPYQAGTMDTCFDSIPSPGMYDEMNKRHTLEETRTTVTSEPDEVAHVSDKSDTICSPEVHRPKPFGSNPSSPLGLLNAVLGKCSPKSWYMHKCCSLLLMFGTNHMWTTWYRKTVVVVLKILYIIWSV